jgi:hypothetical protein
VVETKEQRDGWKGMGSNRKQATEGGRDSEAANFGMEGGEDRRGARGLGGGAEEWMEGAVAP